ncbi:MAG: response regulator [Marinomonas atlantica]|nr:response regulator [Marinomonas atlantica]
MLWIIGALAIGYISIYAAFRELTSELIGSDFQRALRCALALTLGIGSTTLISHNAFFDHQSHTLQPLPLFIWFLIAITANFLIVLRTRFDCKEQAAMLNMFSGIVSFIIISLTCAILAANGENLLEALVSISFWLLIGFCGLMVTFAFYACVLVSTILNRPSMLNYRYFTRPLMLTACIALIQVAGGEFYPDLTKFKQLDEQAFTLSREQFLLGVALLSSVVSTLLLCSNFYSRYLGSELKYLQEQLSSRSSSHTFWQAFITLLSFSLMAVTLVFWLQWHSALSQHNSVTAVSMRNAINASHNELESLVADIQSVKNTFSIDPDAILTSPSYREKLQNFLEGYSLSSDRYRYISVLDGLGNEVARVDNNRSTPIFSAGNHLGEMNHSLEYRIAQSLDDGEFFISHVSLARKHSTPIAPLRPILKIGVPIFDHYHNRIGILVFAYKFERFVTLLERFFPENRNVFLLNESNQILIDLSSPESWEHLLRVTNFRFIQLNRQLLQPNLIDSDEKQTHILNSGLFPNNLNGSASAFLPSWRLVAQSAYPDITVKPWNIAFVLILIVLSFLLAKLISRTVLNNIENRTQISELLNEVGYHKQALDEHAIVSISNTRGHITYVNDKFCEISGYEKTELMGQNHRILKSDEHPPEFFKTLWHTIANGKVWSGEIKNLRKNGSIYWVHATILPIKGTSGKIERYIAVRTDVTESRVISTILEDALKEAHQAAEAKNRFLANISHEIRTPMNAIIGLTDACLTSPNKENQQDLMRKVNNSANNLLRIINDILDFSKMEAGHMEVEEIPFSLERVIEEHAYIHQSVAKSKNIHLLTGIDSNVPNHLIGDPLRIGQVLSNLVSNALKFTSAGEVIVYVKMLRTKGELVELEFSVQDTGTGMTEAQLNKLFSPFSQADVSTTRKYGGTGLGLSICKSLIGLMGGTIQVDSRYGDGSVFRFTVPLKVDQSDLQSLPNKAKESLNSSRVLLIDFIGLSRQNYLRHASAFGLHLEAVSTCDNAVSKLSFGAAYDFLIIDCYSITPELEDILKHLNDFPASRSLKTIIVVDHSKDLRRIEQWHSPITLLAPPVSQSSLLDCMMPFRQDINQPSTSSIEKEPKEFAHLKVLVVEDNEINQLVIGEIFSQWDISFEIAEHGRDAIRLVQQQPFDMVLMDIQMPVMDGYEASKGIRALGGEFTNLPIIAVTANTGTQDIQRALKSGMNDHVSKPISRQQLQDVIRQQMCLNKGAYLQQKSGSLEPEQVALANQLVMVLPNIDVQSALSRLGVEPSFYLQLLNSFKESSVEHMLEAQAKIASSDFEGLIQTFHTIKGIAGNLGARSIYNEAKDLEQAAKQRDVPEGLFNQMHQEIMTICQSISELSSNTKSSQDISTTTLELEHTLTFENCLALLDLIEAFDTKANAHIHKLMNDQKNTSISQELEKIEQQLSNYNFEDAADILRTLMDSLK